MEKGKKQGITILVIEDELPLVKAISDKLSRYGFQVVTARAVNEALSALEQAKQIDAVWLDHYL